MAQPFKPDLPKADLHVHLEGTITPDMVMTLAARNHIPVPEGLIKDGKFVWDEAAGPAESLVSFLKVYDLATGMIKTAEDYADITYDFLIRSAKEGCIYAELTISADHGAMVGLSYSEMLAAIERGYERAKKETGIEARLISTCVRHFGVEGALAVGKLTKENPHPLVTAFGMAGNENAHAVSDFKPAFEASGLAHRTAHAGEAAGPESVRMAKDLLSLRRFGHMVRAIEDADLIRDLQKIKAVPEVCVTSNLAMKVFNSVADHPLRKFFDAGLKVTLGSDDPSFFNTSIGEEYRIAQEKFGLTDAELLQVTRNAIEEAFVDEPTRKRMLGKLILRA